MRLLRFGNTGQGKPGTVESCGNIRDLSGLVDDFSGAGFSLEVLAEIGSIDSGDLPEVDYPGRICCYLSDIPNFYCNGLIYAKYAAESGMPVPIEPVLFNKATFSISGPFEDVNIPRVSVKGDWEVELGVFIGKSASYVSEADALDYVAGYCVINDMSERNRNAIRFGIESVAIFEIG